jgi:hypothetical protein
MRDEVVSVQARLCVDGPATASMALWDWLRSDRELRGRINQEPCPPRLARWVRSRAS